MLLLRLHYDEIPCDTFWYYICTWRWIPMWDISISHAFCVNKCQSCGFTTQILLFPLQKYRGDFYFNSLRPSDAYMRHHWRSGSTLAQVMDCCLMTPSRYLNQCWLIYLSSYPGYFQEPYWVTWQVYGPETITWGQFHKIPQRLIVKISLEITYLKWQHHSCGVINTTVTQCYSPAYDNRACSQSHSI